ncbi:PrsW family intramembrane metalloprotease [Streptomyces candidus]|uniref:RsiW-degrading membrane proteinase PrsW (M82 family) n=1 Tax=Streptomyces candidus TaxID=67283 RepID=A0A7X0HIS7_9ACTN|nr:PrsW family intramembrane metalloprotease [Streptomyces candidus]MBB6437119.1 RsiW-degrading membrane proteinase PrsW (M82 family) [Streptomyces candidus]GHH37877.1 protease PrsW [Streptomyces candidus]
MYETYGSPPEHPAAPAPEPHPAPAASRAPGAEQRPDAVRKAPDLPALPGPRAVPDPQALPSPHSLPAPGSPPAPHSPPELRDPPPAVPDLPPWPYPPRRTLRHRVRHHAFWRSRTVRASALVVLLALSGLVLLALVREQTGTRGFLVGLGLAVFPVPLLLSAFRWLDRVEPGPWRNLVFAFTWGSCAAALIAITANSFAVHWIAVATADPDSADTLGATVVAPVVEECAKAAAILLIFLFRRKHFTGIVDGIVIAGFTATGFAFTENILYLGNAFGEDQSFGGPGLGAVTAGTFFVRVIMSPFAHPLFTVLTGIGFGLVALVPARRGRRRAWVRIRRVVLPLLGLLLAMGMHALWNGSASFGPLAFYGVYGLFMVPTFAFLTWLAIWTRQRELRMIGAELPAYAAAGWLDPAEPLALSSMHARSLAQGHAARTHGPGAARAVAEYEEAATALAFLRYRARRGTATRQAAAEFTAGERELLHRLWERKRIAGPALVYAAQVTGRIRMLPPPYHPAYAAAYNPYRNY